MSILNPNLKGFYETNTRNYILYGGRSSSKTYHTAGFSVFLSKNYRVKFLCVRQFQNRISDSVKTVIEECIYNARIEDEYRITDNEIEHKKTGSTFAFLGIQRNLKEIKGIAGIDILWIEEAEGLTPEQWKILEPTIREEGSKIWIVFNPAFIADFVYQKFIVETPPDTIVRKINYDENPFLSNTSRKIIEHVKETDPELYEHVYLGVPLSDDERCVIKRSWIEAAIDAHIKLGFEPQGQRVIGFDVADDGGDLNANVLAHGSVALWCEEWKGLEDELLKSCSRTFQNAVTRGADIRYDCIGVGASAGAKFDELNSVTSGKKVRYSKFNAGAAVFEPERYYAQDRMEKIKNKDFFSNLKAQAWWLVADRFRNTFDAIKNGTTYPVDDLISISSAMPHLEKLKSELSTPRRDFDKNGRVKVESKKDLADREIKSPNIADAFINCFAPHTAPMKVSPAAIHKFGGVNLSHLMRK